MRYHLSSAAPLIPVRVRSPIVQIPTANTTNRTIVRVAANGKDAHLFISFYFFMFSSFFLFLIQHTVGRTDGEATPTARLNFSTFQLLTYSKCSRPVDPRSRSKPKSPESDSEHHKTNQRSSRRQRTHLGRKYYRRICHHKYLSMPNRHPSAQTACHRCRRSLDNTNLLTLRGI